jgi:hypothetical protein
MNSKWLYPRCPKGLENELLGGGSKRLFEARALVFDLVPFAFEM